MNTVPEIRIRKANEAPVNPKGAFVLYWMIANRRTRWNFSLDRAVQWANELKKPLIILEALRMGYPWASDRLHAFIVQGMTDNARRVKKRGALYYPYVESKPDQGKECPLTLLGVRSAGFSGGGGRAKIRDVLLEDHHVRDRLFGDHVLAVGPCTGWGGEQ